MAKSKDTIAPKLHVESLLRKRVGDDPSAPVFAAMRQFPDDRPAIHYVLTGNHSPFKASWAKPLTADQCDALHHGADPNTVASSKPIMLDDLTPAEVDEINEVKTKRSRIGSLAEELPRSPHDEFFIHGETRYDERPNARFLDELAVRAEGQLDMTIGDFLKKHGA